MMRRALSILLGLTLGCVLFASCALTRLSEVYCDFDVDCSIDEVCIEGLCEPSDGVFSDGDTGLLFPVGTPWQTGQVGVWEVVFHAGFVYWITSIPGGCVYRRGLEEDGFTSLGCVEPPAVPTSLAVSNVGAFVVAFTDGADRLYKVDFADDNVFSLFASPIGKFSKERRSVVVDGEWVSVLGEGRVFRYANDFAVINELELAGGGVRNLSQSATDLFWLEGPGEIRRMEIDSFWEIANSSSFGGLPFTATSIWATPQALFATFDEERSVVRRVEYAGLTTTPVVDADPLNDGRTTLVTANEDGDVCWATISPEGVVPGPTRINGTLYCKLVGDERATPIAGLDQLGGISLGGGYVFWTENATGTVWQFFLF